MTETTFVVTMDTLFTDGTCKPGSVGKVLPNTLIKVPPAEIEAVLLQHEGVRDVGVVGLPNPEAGELPIAFVVPQLGANPTEAEMQHFVAERLSNPKHLRGGVHFVKEIPRTATGKILRKNLRELAVNLK
ncbi:luciferin 4-monooxygenase-like [Papilio machaon]|uniref:luciferin 4-monooxygenase-like n=1 Tax=Papilio machaon TaxID=76193 RepID=UPI001E6660AD|nr:luciferin 4-monooxygenase-like [Papilio machaon]